MRDTKFYLKAFSALCLFVVIVGYAYFQSRNIRNGPSISIFSPQDGVLLESPTVEFKGKAENISEITLDGNPIVIDESGNFNEKRALLPGFNVVSFEAKDKFNRKTSKNIELVYRENSDSSVIQ